MSLVQYNGVALPYCFTTQFDQEAIRDPSNTDTIYTKYSLTFQTVLNTNYTSTISNQIPNGITNPADIMNFVRGQLLQPRKQLSVTVNGVNLIPNAISQGTVDAKNGPIPKMCSIARLTDTTFLVTYSIDAHYHECNRVNGSSPLITNQEGNDVLTNRWTESVDIDNANYTTRTREGYFIIRSDNADGLIADQLRTQFAVVGIPPGFLRVSSNYAVTPDGLTLRYRIVDREQFKMPPYPAFEADGDFYETSTFIGGYRKMLEARVRLKGDKVTDQALLIQTAVAVAASKISINIPNNAIVRQQTVIEHSIVNVKMYSNEVECRIKASIPVLDIGDNGIWGLDYEGLTFTPGSDAPANPPTPRYFDYGTANILLEAASYFDPCLRQSKLEANLGQTTPGFQPGTGGATLETTGGSAGPLGATGPGGQSRLQTQPPPANVILTSKPPPINPYTLKALNPDLTAIRTFFTDFTIHSRYEKNRHVYMMPVASPAVLGKNSVAFVQLASPTLFWVVDWTAAKYGQAPNVPDPNNPVDTNWVLLAEHYEPHVIALAADGVTPLYRLSGTYFYGHLSPSELTVDNISFSRPPWLPDGAIPRNMPRTQLQPRLMDGF